MATRQTSILNFSPCNSITTPSVWDPLLRGSLRHLASRTPVAATRDHGPSALDERTILRLPLMAVRLPAGPVDICYLIGGVLKPIVVQFRIVLNANSDEFKRRWTWRRRRSIDASRPGFRITTRSWWAVLLLGLLIGVGLAAIFGGQSGDRPRTVMPNVVGLPLTTASKVLSERQIRWRLSGTDAVYDSPLERAATAPRDRVVAQEPQAGSDVGDSAVAELTTECSRRGEGANCL